MLRTDDLAALTVQDESGRSTPLGELWRSGTAILVFVRHFGCIHCREHVVQLHRHLDAFEAKGAKMIVIGSGSPSFIAGFREETLFDGPIYTDPSLAVYRAADLKRSVTATLDPRSLFGAAKALANGIRQGRTQGDQWQQGGVLVVASSGELRWHHASDRPGDNAPAQQILAVL